MKDQHIPFELLENLKTWVNNNVSEPINNDNIRKELYEIKMAITTLKKRYYEIPEKVQRDHDELEAKVNSPSEEEQMLEDLAEKLDLLSKDIKQRIKKTGGSRKSSGKKGPRKILTVILPDGGRICKSKAIDTFIETLRYLGLKKCASFTDIISQGHPVVSTRCDDDSPTVKEVDGYFIERKTGNDQKARMLKKYAERLGVDIKVEVQ